MSKDKIYLSENGYQEYLQAIEKLKEKLDTNSKSKKSAYEEAPGDGWHDNFVYEDLIRNENNLLTQMENLVKTNEKIQILKKKNKADIVDIEDKIELELQYEDGFKETDVFELNANYYTKHSQEISINSPLGQAIYGKKIGSLVTYQANNQLIQVTIIRKI